MRPRRVVQMGKVRVPTSKGFTPLLRVPHNQRRFTNVKSQEVMQRAHERALRASSRMQERAERAFKRGNISLEEYFRVRKAIEKKQVGLLSRVKAQSMRMSERDPMLTMLFNKAKMEEKIIPHFFAQHPRASVVLVDIDHFRSINTMNGHEAGDTALRFMGRYVNEVARKLAGWGGRIGGEEFAVVLPEGKKDAVKFVQLLNQELVNGFAKNQAVRSALQNKLFTLSMGVGLATEAKDWISLKERVDQRLYHSKHSGRNRVTYSDLKPRIIRKAA